MTNLRKTWQIDQGQVQDIRAVDAQGDRQLRYTLVLPCYPERLGLDFASDIREIGEAFVGVQELAVLLGGRRGIDQLKDKRAASNNPLASWQKVATNDPD
jgi:hypothetical protein